MAAQPRELARRLNSAAVHLMRALRSGPARSGLAAEHQLALTAIVFSGPLSIGTLARREGVGAPAMTKTVGILERQRLVRRTRDATDARVVQVHATAAGRRAVLRRLDGRVVRIARALTELDRSDLRALDAAIGSLERLVVDLESRPLAPAASGPRKRPERGVDPGPSE